MSERLADVGRRIATVRQLGAVVNAMRGIAGARAQQSRAMLPAIRAYADVAAGAIAQAQRLAPASRRDSAAPRPDRPVLILFGAEQGFAGAYPEEALKAAHDEFARASVFVVGSRTAALARERGLTVHWETALPSRAAAIPDTATAIVDALYGHLGSQGATVVSMMYFAWVPGRRAGVVRDRLLPVDPAAVPPARSGEPPLTNLAPADLIERLGEEYIFALVCAAAAEAFAAENEARMATMAAAKTNIDGKLAGLEVEERLTRQEEITAEVVELAAGARARR